ncbi:MAG: hypothetical protein JXB19_01680 [Bacteroidales bacterium]|nr:hypothetical protein [Bacteroidales bacterium]
MDKLTVKNAIFLIAFVLLSAVSFGQKKKYSYSDTTVNGMKFSEIIYILDRKTKDTLLIEGILKEKTVIEDIPCAGDISLTKDWIPREFTLADEHNFGGNTFPEGTYVRLDVNWTSLKYLWAVRWSGNKFVNVCKLGSTQLIDGISCAAYEEVVFETDWNLLACILAEEDTIAGNVLEQGTFVRFDKDGTICCFCLYDPQLQGYLCSGTDYTSWLWSGGMGIFLYPNGRLHNFYPVEDIEIQGVYCKRSLVRGPVYLYESGRLRSCIAAREQTINGVLYRKNSRLVFDENGRFVNP